MRNIHWVIIVLGVALRLREYFFNRSLEMDEAHWALLIINQPIKDFFTVMLGNQVAPPFYLIVERLAVTTFGDSEYSLRLFPLILGILSILLFYKLAERLLPKTFATVALTLFVLSDYLILYSTMVKRYSGDVFFALAIFLAALKVMDKRIWNTSSLVILILLGILAPWFSYTSVLILAGAALALLFSVISQKDNKKLYKLLTIFVFWGIGLALFYSFHLRLLADSQGYHGEYFSLRGVFAPLPTSFTALEWYFKSFAAYFEKPLELHFLNLGVVLFLIGSVYTFVKNKIKFILLISPLLLALLASNRHIYPFFDRYLLFTLPTTLILIVIGIRFISKIGLIPVVVITLLLLINPLITASQYLTRPRAIEEIRPVLQFLKDHQRSDDLLYLYYAARPPFEYYGKKFGLDNLRLVRGNNWRDNQIKYINDLNKLMGDRRVWILFSHLYQNEELFFLNYLRSRGRLLLSHHDLDSSVYLFDLSLR